MTEEEFAIRMKEIFKTNQDAMSLITAKEFFEAESDIPYDEFQGMKYAYLEHNRDSIMETIDEGQTLNAVAAIFERAFLFGYMLKGLDKGE